MFAPRVVKPKSVPPQRSAVAARRSDQAAVTQRQLLQRTISNQATLRLLARRAGATSNASGPIQAKLKIGAVNDPLEHEADHVADRVRRMPAPEVSVAAALRQVSRKCADCEEEKLQRKSAGPQAASSEAPAIVHQELCSPGQPLDAATRACLEPRFGQDFSGVRVHTDGRAARSAQAVDSLAYTVGRNIVFASGQYRPRSIVGQRLIAHELTHVVQQGAAHRLAPRAYGLRLRSEGANQVGPPLLSPHTATQTLQRTPARKVDCASTAPLRLPSGDKIDDPVGVITAAEQRANELLDEAIVALDSTRRRILAGSPVGWPAISDALGFGLELMGLDPNSERVWRGTGGGTAALLLLRLRWIRGEIGSGSFFFTCLGPERDTAGNFLCGSRTETATEVVIKQPAIAATDRFHIYLCEPFWNSGLEEQADTIIHESAHTFGTFIEDERARGPHVAACYARFTAIVGGSPGDQRKDLCPDPPD